MHYSSIKILGTRYKLQVNDKEHDFLLRDRYAYCDPSSKKIVICNLEKEDDIEQENVNEFKNKLLRHEIIHAFLVESGLNDACDWHCEEMVDWLAMQFPKLSSLFDQLNI